MREETHVTIIEVLAAKIDLLTKEVSAYERRDHSNTDVIIRLDEDVITLTEKLSLKDTEIARLKEENDSITKRFIRENTKNYEKLTATIKEREAEANSYKELYNELKKAITGMNTSTPKDTLGEVAYVREELKKIEASCDSRDIPHMASFASVSNKVEHLAQLYVLALKYRDRSNIFEAKSSKLNAEKRKLMSLIRKQLPDGIYDRFIGRYQRWLESQAKKRKGGK